MNHYPDIDPSLVQTIQRWEDDQRVAEAANEAADFQQFDQPVQPQLCTYKAFFKGRTMELQAESSYAAQRRAALLWGIGRRSWEVTVVLIARGDAAVPVSTASL